MTYLVAVATTALLLGSCKEKTMGSAPAKSKRTNFGTMVVEHLDPFRNMDHSGSGGSIVVSFGPTDESTNSSNHAFTMTIK